MATAISEAERKVFKTVDGIEYEVRPAKDFDVIVKSEKTPPGNPIVKVLIDKEPYQYPLGGYWPELRELR